MKEGWDMWIPGEQANVKDFIAVLKGVEGPNKWNHGYMGDIQEE
jgi:hypothetical protein